MLSEAGIVVKRRGRPALREACRRYNAGVFEKQEVVIMLPIPKIELPKGRELVVFSVDMISVIVGLAVAVYPFLGGLPFGSSLMTYHMAMGLLVAALAFLRGNLPVGSAWVEIIVFACGAFIAATPWFWYLTWNSNAMTGYIGAGAVVMGASVLSAILTPKAAAAA